MTIDITPEAVERLACILEGRGGFVKDATVAATLRALSAALAAPPDPNTRIVTVDQLELWITVIEATESCLKTWNGSGSFMDVDGALSQIRAIIGKVK